MNPDLMNLLKIVAIVAGVLIGGSVAFAAIKIAFAAGKTVSSIDRLTDRASMIEEDLKANGVALETYAKETNRILSRHDRDIERMKEVIRLRRKEDWPDGDEETTEAGGRHD